MVFKFKYWAIPYLGAVFFVGTTVGKLWETHPTLGQVLGVAGVFVIGGLILELIPRRFLYEHEEGPDQ
jgi:hypothetical protein